MREEMISNKDGRISFISELTETIQRFVEEYEKKEGTLSGELERGLVISYALGVMRCDLEAIWQELGEASIFQRLHPRDLFEECVEEESEDTQQKLAIKEALMESPLKIELD
jgi:hypothetical protein